MRKKILRDSLSCTIKIGGAHPLGVIHQLAAAQALQIMKERIFCREESGKKSKSISDCIAGNEV